MKSNRPPLSRALFKTSTGNAGRKLAGAANGKARREPFQSISPLNADRRYLARGARGVLGQGRRDGDHNQPEHRHTRRKEPVRVHGLSNERHSPNDRLQADRHAADVRPRWQLARIERNATPSRW